jgi:hypothetical protein
MRQQSGPPLDAAKPLASARTAGGWLVTQSQYGLVGVVP